MVDLVPIEELKQKAITDVSISDVKMELDTKKSYEEQAEDVASAMAVAAAVQDEQTQRALVDVKKDEMLGKATAKAIKGKNEVKEAEKRTQEAEARKTETLFGIFGIKGDFKPYLQVIIEILLLPFYVVYLICIAAPLGAVTVLMNSLEAIIVKYEKTDAPVKPKIRVTVIVLLILVTLGAICLTVLGCLRII